MMRLRYLFFLACKSAWNRRGTLLLILLSIALSSALLLGVERLRVQVRNNFVQSVSGTDLIVGPRGSAAQLVLYAIYHLGSATNNMSWQAAKAIASRPQVAWTIPISLGDSHRDFPVVATTDDFYAHYRIRNSEHLTFFQGSRPTRLFDVVLGSKAAAALGYKLNDPVTLSHGSGAGAKLAEHSEMPFAVSGILAATGTPVDRSLFISLQAMEAIHVNWRGGAPIPGVRFTAEEVSRMQLEPETITALLVGLKKRGHVFALQREINNGEGEALMGVLPGVTLSQIWEMLNAGESVLLLVSALVTAVGLAGLAAAILAGLGERRRELAILRSAGASPADILLLMLFEGLLLVASGTASGLASLYGLIAAAAPWLATNYGIFLSLEAPSSPEWLLLAQICAAGLIASLIPAVRAYRMSLADGLTVSV